MEDIENFKDLDGNGNFEMMGDFKKEEIILFWFKYFSSLNMNISRCVSI